MLLSTSIPAALRNADHVQVVRISAYSKHEWIDEVLKSDLQLPVISQADFRGIAQRVYDALRGNVYCLFLISRSVGKACTGDPQRASAWLFRLYSRLTASDLDRRPDIAVAFCLEEPAFQMAAPAGSIGPRSGSTSCAALPCSPRLSVHGRSGFPLAEATIRRQRNLNRYAPPSWTRSFFSK